MPNKDKIRERGEEEGAGSIMNRWSLLSGVRQRNVR
jgi:hypothetical protein